MAETISEIASRKIGGLLLLENNAFMIAPRWAVKLSTCSGTKGAFLDRGKLWDRELVEGGGNLSDARHASQEVSILS